MFFVYLIWGLFAFAILLTVILVVYRGITASLTFIKDNADAIKIFILIIAGAYTAAVFHLEVRNRRIASTLEYSKKLDEIHLYKAFSTMTELWIRGEGYSTIMEYRKIENSKATNQEKNEANKVWAKKAQDFVRNNQYESHIMTLHTFYRDIIVCVDQNRCDEETACQLFANNVQNFRLTYRYFLGEWEDAWKGDIIEILGSFHSNCVKKGYINS